MRIIQIGQNIIGVINLSQNPKGRMITVDIVSKIISKNFVCEVLCTCVIKWFII